MVTDCSKVGNPCLSAAYMIDRKGLNAEGQGHRRVMLVREGGLGGSFLTVFITEFVGDILHKYNKTRKLAYYNPNSTQGQDALNCLGIDQCQAQSRIGLC